jgi:hypothetical protein
VCGKVADLLSDPKDDAKPSAQEAAEAQELAAQVAQMQLKAAPTPSSPHVPGSQAGLMQEYGEANLGGNVFSGFAEGAVGEAAEASVGMSASVPAGVSEAAEAWLEGTVDADMMADMVPDLTLRMDELQCATDAQGSYDNMGLMEQEDVTQPGAAAQPQQSDVAGTPQNGVNSDSLSTPRSGVKSGSSGASGDATHSPAAKVEENVASVLRQRRGLRMTPDATSSSAGSVTSAGISSAASSPVRRIFTEHSSTAEGEGDEGQTEDGQRECAAVQATAVDAAVVEGELPAVEATAQAEVDIQAEALREMAATRAHIENAMAEVNNRMRVIDQHLAEVRDGPGMGVGDEVVQGGARRDSVDEWLGVVLVALGSTIALMMWRIGTRYYTLFLA